MSYTAQEMLDPNSRVYTENPGWIKPGATNVGGSSTSNTLTNNSGVLSGDLLKTLEDKLLGSVNAVSSSNSEFDNLLADYQKNLETTKAKQETGIKASYERQRGEVIEAGTQTLTSELESRRGFATNTALIKQIENDTQKNLRDLDLREQEALASGATDVADKITSLKLKALEFKQDSQQQAFSNILSLSTALLNKQSAETSSKNTLADNFRQTYVSTGAIANMDDSQLSQLQGDSGMTLDQLKSLKSSIVKEKGAYKQFSVIDSGTSKVVVGITEDGQVKTLKTIADTGGGTSEFGKLSSADLSKAFNYVLLNGGTESDVKRFQTDRAFQAWALEQAKANE